MLTVDNIHFSISRKEIIEGVKFNIEKGVIKGLLGKNGAGKTTLFRLLFGFYKPSKGSILFDGSPVKKQHVSFFETEQYFYPLMRGKEYLNLISTSNTEIEKWNEIFDLPLNEMVDHYSTGMKKKLGFMGILLQNRPILLLDEPFNGVDLEGNEQMVSILNHLKKDKIILISSHVLSLLTSISDEITVLDQGKITTEIPKEQFNTFEAKLKTEIDHKIQDILKDKQ